MPLRITIITQNSLINEYELKGTVAKWPGWTSPELKDEIFRVIPEFAMAYALDRCYHDKLASVAEKLAIEKLSRFDPVNYKIV